MTISAGQVRPASGTGESTMVQDVSPNLSTSSPQPLNLSSSQPICSSLAESSRSQQASSESPSLPGSPYVQLTQVSSTSMNAHQKSSFAIQQLLGIGNSATSSSPQPPVQSSSSPAIRKTTPTASPVSSPDYHAAIVASTSPAMAINPIPTSYPNLNSLRSGLSSFFEFAQISQN